MRANELLDSEDLQPQLGSRAHRRQPGRGALAAKGSSSFQLRVPASARGGAGARAGFGRQVPEQRRTLDDVF